MKRLIGKHLISNCWLVFAWLLLSDKLSGAVFCNSFTRALHPMGITRSGNLVHFKSDKTRDGLSPLLFRGRIQVFNTKLFDKKGSWSIRWR